MSDNNIVQFPGRPSTTSDYDGDYDPFKDDFGEPIEVVVHDDVDPPRERNPWRSLIGGLLLGSWLSGA